MIAALRTVSIIITLLISMASLSHAQELATDEPEIIEDEIIVEGKRNWRGHKGMEAFWNGDFERSEIEFEKEFKILKRRESALFNLANDSALSQERSLQQSQATQNNTSISGPSAAGAQSNPSSSAADLGLSGNYRSSKAIGRNILNDGKDTEYDFGFTKYMSGLSELQLGKYDEAKSSFKTAIHFDRKNFDARMRLGLLYVLEGNLDKAADQLEKIEKQRVKCKKKDCDRYLEIREAAATLASGISKTIQQNNPSQGG